MQQRWSRSCGVRSVRCFFWWGMERSPWPIGVYCMPKTVTRQSIGFVLGHAILCNLDKAVEIRECFRKARVTRLKSAKGVQERRS
jgi:hypothetical protein